MKDQKYGLFLKRRFLPIFTAQFLGGCNDNLLRSGLVVMIAYASQRGIELPMRSAEVLVTICSALLVMPFILFSFLAGQLADKYEKARLVTITKVIEIGIMSTACYGFAHHNIYLLMTLLFISGTHSTFFGPIKYSILPEHLRPGELLAGNGFISAGTFLGILVGLIAGGLLVAIPGHAIGYTAISLACVGLVASLFIPRTISACPDMKMDFHLISGTVGIVKHACHARSVMYSILGLSWFLMVGSVFMAQFPNYAHTVTHGDNEVYTLFLEVFSIGIALGSMLCDVLLKGEVSPRYSPYALLGVSFFTYLMVFTSPPPMEGPLLGYREFLLNPHHFPLLLSMLLVAVCGGIYMVPLYALLQTESLQHARSRVIAASNLSDSLMMTVAAIICVILLAFGLSITDLFLVLATLNVIVFLYVRKAAKAFARRAA